MLFDYFYGVEADQYNFIRLPKLLMTQKEYCDISLESKLLYDLYLQGYGTTTIARRLTELGCKNKHGEVKWQTDTILDIIKNEKHCGDLLLGKTFTVDPITKRRLDNMGEENQYYIRDHHEAIVSREVWEKAKEIRLSRAKSKWKMSSENRQRYTRLYAFSSMLECGYCGYKLARRTRHQTTVTKKPVWQCINASKNGICNCPNSKAIDESILESAFIDAFHVLADNFDDVKETVIETVESSLNDDGDVKRIKHLNKEISSIKTKKSRLTELLIDDRIEQGEYDQKKIEFQRKLHQLSEEKQYLEDNVGRRKNISKRMSELRETLETEKDPLTEFDRMVFDSITEKVIVGGYDADNNPAPYNLKFIFKCDKNIRVKDAKSDYKQKHPKKGNVVK